MIKSGVYQIQDDNQTSGFLLNLIFEKEFSNKKANLSSYLVETGLLYNNILYSFYDLIVI